MLDKKTQTLSIDGNGNYVVQIIGNENYVVLKPEDIENFEQQDVLSKTIEYILKENNFTFNFGETINLSTDIDKKIHVNNINSSLKTYLGSGISKRYLIDELFEDNTQYNIEDLRKDVIKIYTRYRNTLDDMNIVIQKLYEDILNKFTKRDASTSISIFIVISYFFELCDVGDNPNDYAQ